MLGIKSGDAIIVDFMDPPIPKTISVEIAHRQAQRAALKGRGRRMPEV
jgi:hypothetical protein